MEILKALLMGLVQGFTEFLPVSSSGHLAILSNVLHVQMDSTILYEVMLHFGTLIAVIIVFREDIGKLIREFFMMLLTCIANLVICIKRAGGKSEMEYIKVVNNSYRKMVLMVIISTIPTGILGFLGGELIEKASESLLIVGVCLLITAVMLVIADVFPRGKDRIKDVPYPGAFLLGIAQGIATLPGISRSGFTISCGIMIGMTKKTAVRYSFIMSIPAILGATILKLLDLSKEPINTKMLPGYILGTIIAGVTGYISIKYMLKIVRKRRYFGFAIYCVALAAIAIAYWTFNK